MKVYDRAAGICREEKEYGKKSLEFLYHTVPGRMLLKVFFSRRIYSELNGIFMRSRLSVRKIEPFIREYGVDLSDCDRRDFKSFDDFFTRSCRICSDAGEGELIAPCQGRLAVYDIDEQLVLNIKGSVYTLPELVDHRWELSQFGGGVCLVYRLSVENCHRYFFCDDGEILKVEEIPGFLHTIRPISERYRVFCRNHRVCTLMRTKHFGDVMQIEVGALQIGKINNHEVTGFSRMDEKGYFRYGGSTIIQLLGPGAVLADEDIRLHSADGVETLVKAGERVAASPGRPDRDGDGERSL